MYKLAKDFNTDRSLIGKGTELKLFNWVLTLWQATLKMSNS